MLVISRASFVVFEFWLADHSLKNWGKKLFFSISKPTSQQYQWMGFSNQSHHQQSFVSSGNTKNDIFTLVTSIATLLDLKTKPIRYFGLCFIIELIFFFSNSTDWVSSAEVSFDNFLLLKHFWTLKSYVFASCIGNFTSRFGLKMLFLDFFIIPSQWSLYPRGEFVSSMSPSMISFPSQVSGLCFFDFSSGNSTLSAKKRKKCYQYFSAFRLKFKFRSLPQLLDRFVSSISWLTVFFNESLLEGRDSRFSPTFAKLIVPKCVKT